MAAAPARRATVHDHRPRRVVPRTAMDHAGPADHDPAVVAAVAAIMPTVMTVVVSVGAAFVPVAGVVATTLAVVVAAAAVVAMAVNVVAGGRRGGLRHSRQGDGRKRVGEGKEGKDRFEIRGG